MSDEPPLSTLRLEDDILLRCARARWSPVADRLSQMLSRDVDWSYLSWSAEAHGILPLLSWHLEACDWTMVPDRVRDSLSLASRENERRATLASAWIGSTAALLESERVPVLMTRGASSRLVSEIDMLVRKRDLGVAHRVLASNGCTAAFATPGTTTARERIFCKANRGYVLGAERVDVPINLRYSMTPSSFPVAVDIERLFLGARRIALAGSTILVPSAPDLVLASCLRGTLHLWKRLSDLCDLSELIGQHPDLDWDALFAHAQRARCSSAVALGLMLAGSRLRVELPARVRDEIGRDARAMSMASAVSAPSFTPARRVIPFSERLRFHLALRDTLVRKIEQCLTIAVPGPQDAPASAIPPWLDPLFYMVRPLRYAGDVVARVADVRPQRPRWCGTPIEIVDRLLRLARVASSDCVYDLGCGEGRIVIYAATHFGARGVGLDVDEALVDEARQQARLQRVGDRVSFERLDAFDADLRSATLVTLTLAPQWNDRIAPKLRAELPPGARIVAVNTDIAGWEPQGVEIVRVGDHTCRLYLWEIDRHRAMGAHA
ncbi:MAG TPA: nucleotidyltransferase family protein [Vicinamibacterales bacterium]|nr:nucleotidyltransferase family protein [Vicinamibacterales bacterium]